LLWNSIEEEEEEEEEEQLKMAREV